MTCFVFAVFSLVPKFKLGITRPETLVERQRLFHSRTCHANYTKSIPTSVTNRRVRKSRRKFQLIISLAFGGRGVGLLHNNHKVIHVDFDSAKGFPGEGWSAIHSNFKIGAARSLGLTSSCNRLLIGYRIGRPSLLLRSPPPV